MYTYLSALATSKRPLSPIGHVYLAFFLVGSHKRIGSHDHRGSQRTKKYNASSYGSFSSSGVLALHTAPCIHSTGFCAEPFECFFLPTNIFIELCGTELIGALASFAYSGGTRSRFADACLEIICCMPLCDGTY